MIDPKILNYIPEIVFCVLKIHDVIEKLSNSIGKKQIIEQYSDW